MKAPRLAHAPLGTVRPRRRGLTLLLPASIIVSFLAASSAPTPLHALYAAQRGFSPLATTVVFGVYALAVLVSLLTFGKLSDHIGRRPVLLTGPALQAVAMVLFATAGGLGTLLDARIVQGVATGAALAAAGGTLLDLDQRRGALANSSAPGAGTAVGVLVSALAIQYLPAPTHRALSVTRRTPLEARTWPPWNRTLMASSMSASARSRVCSRRSAADVELAVALGHRRPPQRQHPREHEVSEVQAGHLGEDPLRSPDHPAGPDVVGRVVPGAHQAAVFINTAARQVSAKVAASACDREVAPTGVADGIAPHTHHLARREVGSRADPLLCAHHASFCGPADPLVDIDPRPQSAVLASASGQSWQPAGGG